MLEQVVQAGQEAADHRRGRRGRGSGHPGCQQAARHLHLRCRQGSRLRRSPQGHAAGYRHPDRRSRSSPTSWAWSSRTLTMDMLGQCPSGQGRQGEHHHRRRRRRSSARSRPASAVHHALRSRIPPPITTARSCRSVWPSWPAAWPSSRSALLPRWR